MRPRAGAGAWARPQADEGSIAPVVAILGLAFLLLAGLVIDASRQLDARGRALAYAEEAARAGAQSVDPADRELRLDPARAAAGVAAFCGQARDADPSLATCEFVEVDGRDVVARVTTEINASLLGILGVTTLRAEGEGRARTLVGTSEDDAT